MTAAAPTAAKTIVTAEALARPRRIKIDPGTPQTVQQGVFYLAGMDELSVGAAQFDLAALPRRIEVAPLKPPTSLTGVVVAFTEPSRLSMIEIETDAAIRPGVSDKATDLRLLVRVATPAGSGYTAGPPLFAMPSFPAGMFGNALGGMGLESTHSKTKKTVLSFPPTAGAAFLIQFAKGASPLQLTAEEPQPAFGVPRVWVDEVPKDLTIATDSGAVFNHPGTLLPGSKQTVSFRPAAEKLLNGALAAAKSDARMIAVTLRLTASNACMVELTPTAIEAAYRARPPQQPRRVELRGSREPLSLAVPSVPKPTAGSFSLAAKFLGRELNGAYELGPEALPPSGLRVNPVRSAAALAPLAGPVAGASLALASVRLALIAGSDAEVAMELRGDAAGAPGALLAPPAVRQFDATFFGWAELVLPKPLPVVTGNAALWIVLRATKGEALWCAGREHAIPSLLSTDGGGSWGEPETAAAPLLQLFHAATPPPSVDVTLRGGVALHTWTLIRTGPKSEQFAIADASFPPKLLSRFPLPDPRLESRTAIDLTLDALVFSYAAPSIAAF
jgi:hypothetical protein